MTTYFVLFFIIGLFSIKDILKVDLVNRKIIDYLLLIIAISFTGLRYKCDNDYNNYVVMYLNTPDLFDIRGIFNHFITNGTEFGYLFVCAFFKAIGLGSQSIFVFSAFITFFIIFKVIKRHTRFTALAFFVFFAQYFMLPFTQIRFGIAAAISVYACSLLPTPQKNKYWFFIILASSFHLTALGCIVVYFFYKIDWMRRPKYIYIVLLISVLILFIPVGNILVKLINMFFIKRYSSYAMRYINHSEENVLWLSVISNIIIIMPLILYRKIFYNNHVNVNLFLSMALAGIFCGALVWNIGILYRFSAINTMILFMIIPSYIYLIKLSSAKILGYILLLTYCLLKYLNHMQYLSEYATILTI